MFMNEFRNGLFALAAVLWFAPTSGATARPVAFVETVCVPSPSGNGPVWFDQAFFWGGYQYPAGGYGGGIYRPRAYSAADIYVSPPVCVRQTFYRERTRRVAHHRPVVRRRCACATR